MNVIHAPAGQRTVIRTRRHSSMVTDYHFTVSPASPVAAVSGILEITASQWIFPGTPVRQPLQARHSVTAGMWNTFFEMAVIPETAATVAFTDAAFSGNPKRVSLTFYIILTVIAIVAAAILMTAV